MLQWFWYSGELYPAKNIEMEILAVLGCIRELNENGIRKVYGGIIVFSITKNWNVSQPTGFYLILRGSNRNWPWKVSYVRRFAEINNWRVCETSRLTVSIQKRNWKLTQTNSHPHSFNIYHLLITRKKKMKHIIVLHQLCLLLKMLHRKVLPQIPQQPFSLPQKNSEEDHIGKTVWIDY